MKSEKLEFSSPKWAHLVKHYHSPLKAFYPPAYYIGFDEKKEKLVSIVDGSIHTVQLADLKESSITILTLSCSGIALSPDAKLVAVGDMTGKIFIFPAQPTLETQPLYTESPVSSFVCCLQQYYRV